MKISDAQLQQVIHDVAVIRSALQAEDGAPAVASSNVSIHAALHAAILIGAIFILSFDLLTGHAQTQMLLHSAGDADFRNMSLVQAAGALALIVGAIYFLVWRGAYLAGETFEQFATRNFRYLRNLGFASDTLVKFACLTVAIVAKRPDLAPPLLFLFMADYLIQGRLWILTPRVSLVLAIGCLAAAATQVAAGSALIAWPFAGCAAISALSLARLFGQSRRATRGEHA